MGSSHWFFGRDRSAGILLKMRSNSQKNPLYLGYLPLFAGLRSCFDPLALFIKQPGSNWVFWPRLPPGLLWGSGVVGCWRLGSECGKVVPFDLSVVLFLSRVQWILCQGRATGSL